MKKILLPIFTFATAFTPVVAMSSCSCNPGQDDPVPPEPEPAGTMQFYEKLLDDFDKPGFKIEDFDIVEYEKYTFTLDFSKVSDSTLAEWGTGWLIFFAMGKDGDPDPDSGHIQFTSAQVSVDYNDEHIEQGDSRIGIIGEQDNVGFNKNKSDAQQLVAWSKTDKITITLPWEWDCEKAIILCYFWKPFIPINN